MAVMTFEKLASYLTRLEATPSRNSMVEILAQLFKETPTDLIDKVVYLTQGRVAPLFEPVEFGMAEKMVLRALSRAYNKPLDDVTAMFKKVGDLGEVAEKLGDSGRASLARMTVAEVFEKLQEIAATNGAGSVEKKIEVLAKLLQGLDPCSARYVARIPVDKMRLGFSDMTVLEGLSWMLDGTKKHKGEIEAAYNVRPDLGFIAKTIRGIGPTSSAQGGLRGVKGIGPKVGTPVLVMRAERLTNAEGIVEKMGGRAAVEPKIDGLRTQLHFSKRGKDSERAEPTSPDSVGARMTKSGHSGEPALGEATPESSFVKLFSRGMENVTAMYPDLVEAAKKELDCDEVILDGEAIAFDPKTGKYLQFQETVQRKRKYDVQSFSESVPLRLIVFDCLYLNGESLLNKPYLERRKLIEKILDPARMTKIVPARMTIVDKPEELKKIFDKEIKDGQEGIMAKKLDGTYQAGARGWNWIKLKSSYAEKVVDTIDAVVMGLDFGQGKRNKFGVGAFLVGVYDQKTDTYKTLSKIGTGLTDEEWKELKEESGKHKVESKPKNYDASKLMDCDVWVSPKIVGEFKADNLTKSPMHTAGHAMRFPRLVKWRTDKKPEDTTNLQEIEKLAKLK